MEVLINNKIIPIVIIKKNNKNIYFRFDDNLNLIVSTPKRVSEKEINRLISQNISSLAKMLAKTEAKQTKKTEFWYLGNKYLVNFASKENDIIFCDGTVTSPSKEALAKFISNQTKDIFTTEVNKLKEVIKTPNFTLKIRPMKTRWGVCNYVKKTITLNSELIKYRKDLLRYVIIHEMCHFYHHNHSASFWAMVSLYYPDYKEARKELRNS